MQTSWSVQSPAVDSACASQPLHHAYVLSSHVRPQSVAAAENLVCHVGRSIESCECLTISLMTGVCLEAVADHKFLSMIGRLCTGGSSGIVTKTWKCSTLWLMDGSISVATCDCRSVGVTTPMCASDDAAGLHCNLSPCWRV